jgi:AcrR family transcriptional regulator
MTKTKSTREKIEQAAIRLIADRGVDGTAMRDIAAAVGVTEAALYRHFENKSALVWEIFIARYDAFAAYLAALHTPHKSLRAKLEMMIAACCEFFDRDRDQFTFLLLAQHIQRLGPKDYQAALPAMLNQLLQDAIGRKEIPAQDADVSAAMVMGTVLQTALYCLYQKIRSKKMAPLAATLSKAAWHIVKGA